MATWTVRMPGKKGKPEIRLKIRNRRLPGGGEVCLVVIDPATNQEVYCTMIYATWEAAMEDAQGWIRRTYRG